jgi:hypothetical protein
MFQLALANQVLKEYLGNQKNNEFLSDPIVVPGSIFCCASLHSTALSAYNHLSNSGALNPFIVIFSAIVSLSLHP